MRNKQSGMIGGMSLLKIAPLLVLLSISGLLWYQNKSLREDLVASEKHVAELTIKESLLQNNIKYLSESFQNQAVALDVALTNSRVAEEEKNRLQSVLEGYKDRVSVVKAKPKLIERRANAAIDSLMQQYRCATTNESSEDSGC